VNDQDDRCLSLALGIYDEGLYLAPIHASR
jgi:hypothetical protein